jgi:hypothetical protein
MSKQAELKKALSAYGAHGRHKFEPKRKQRFFLVKE